MVGLSKSCIGLDYVFKVLVQDDAAWCFLEADSHRW